MKGKKNLSILPGRLRNLLAVLFLISATAGTAAATAITENSFGEFPATFATRADLGSGVTEVTGAIGAEDNIDFFQLDGLQGGQIFTVNGAYTTGLLFLSVFDTPTGNFLFGPGVSPSTLTVTVPNNGVIVIETSRDSGNTTYDLTFSTSSPAPEPSSFGMMGFGLILASGFFRGVTKLRHIRQ